MTDLIFSLKPINFSQASSKDNLQPYLLKNEVIHFKQSAVINYMSTQLFVTNFAIHLFIRQNFYCFNYHDITDIKQSPKAITIYFNTIQHQIKLNDSTDLFNAIVTQINNQSYLKILPISRIEYALTNQLQFSIATSTNNITQLQQNSNQLVNLINSIRKIIQNNQYQDQKLKDEITLINQELDLQIQNPSTDKFSLKKELISLLQKLKIPSVILLDKLYGRWNKSRGGCLISPQVMLDVCQDVEGWAVKEMNRKKYFINKKFASEIEASVKSRMKEIDGFQFLSKSDFSGFEVDWLEEMTGRGRFLAYDGNEERQYFSNIVGK